MRATEPMPQKCQHLQYLRLPPISWARIPLLPIPGACAPGYMLAPALQAKHRLCLRLLRRLFMGGLPEALANLLGTETPDPVQPKAENHPVLFS